MKKFLKVVGSLAAVGAAVAGGIALYKKYFAQDDILDDFEDELDDEFEEDLDTPGRGYTTINNVAEEVKKEAAEIVEEVKEEAAEVVEEVKEEAAEIAEEVKETLSE